MRKEIVRGNLIAKLNLQNEYEIYLIKANKKEYRLGYILNYTSDFAFNIPFVFTITCSELLDLPILIGMCQYNLEQ